MDDSFRVRVDKVFGSLTPSSSSSLRSLWSLTDEEVEKKEWNRERGDTVDRDENPCSSSFDGFFSNQRKVKSSKLLPDDDEDDDEDDGIRGPGSSTSHGVDDNIDDWEIRSSIGLDSTLDNEEEEDEHDKVALGTENAGDRLYMKDITDYGTYLNSHNIIPESFKDHAKDSRANCSAAIIRLKEDEGASGAFGSSTVAGFEIPTIVDSPLTESGGSLKSILKRKENQDSKSHKRVRFDAACKDMCEEELECTQDSVMVNSVGTNTGAEDSHFPQASPGVPDYIQNPSKYTKYTFDSSSELDEESNRRACAEFLYMMKSSRSDSQEEKTTAVPPKSVKFIPQKKPAAATTVNDISNTKQSQENIAKDHIRKAAITPSIAAAEVEEDEVCAMEEDDQETTAEKNSSNRAGRKYRSKVLPDDSVC